MAETGDGRGRFTLRLAQLLFVVAAGALWGASRLPWLIIRSFDGLGQPRQVTVSGASWSTALLPLALVALAAAVAAVAVRGWPLRLLAVLLAAASLAEGYLAVSLWVGADVLARGADIAGVPVVSLVGGDRQSWGAVITLAAALCTLAGAVLLMRSAAAGGAATKYVPPAARRAIARQSAAGMSERMIWDALDEGCDPTCDPTSDPTSDPTEEGR